MIRKSYLGKFKQRDRFSMNDFDMKDLIEDDNYFLKMNKPIKESEIMTIPSEKLENFVDCILTDNKLNNILFSANAKSEINIIKKTARSLNTKRKEKTIIKKEVNPQDLVLKRAKNEAISKIVLETKNYKDNQKHKLYNLNCKAMNFYKTIKTEKEKNEKDYREYAAEYRKKRFLEIFNSIKAKVRDFAILLPNVELDNKNVYSRLYHNVVYLRKNDENEENLNSEETKELLNTASVYKKEENINNKNQEPSLNIKNVIQNSSGKEFTLKITDKEYIRCFSKHSGGPSIHVKEDDSTNKKEIGFVDLLGMKDENGNSFLHIAVNERLLDLVYYLLVKGLDPNSQNNEGDTSMHLAIKSQDKDIIKLLLDSRASIEILNKKNENPVECASAEIKKFFSLETLLAEKIFARKNK